MHGVSGQRLLRTGRGADHHKGNQESEQTHKAVNAAQRQGFRPSDSLSLSPSEIPDLPPYGPASITRGTAFTRTKALDDGTEIIFCTTPPVPGMTSDIVSQVTMSSERSTM